MSVVLVTGGTGFVGSHCIVQLLAAGHQVRTTIRDASRKAEVAEMLIKEGVTSDLLSFFIADLERDSGWEAATAGCDYVLHVASPFPLGNPKHENDLIIPAREGTFRVLKAARSAAVKRVVLTSSFAAVGYGHKPQVGPFNEGNWTDLSGKDVQPYIKSKTLAERAAWDFCEEKALELAVINPVGVFGPVLGPKLSASLALIQRMLSGGMPVCPRIYFGLVDVRDLADLHIRAMTHPAAAGQRFIAVAGECLSMYEVSKVLRARMGKSARRCPQFQMPDWILRLLAVTNPAVKAMVPQIGKIRRATSEKAQRLLDWRPRPNDEIIVATGESLLRFGLIKN